MKQKVVIKVSRNGGKSRTKAKKIAIRTEAMKIAAGVSGCESVAICRQDVDQMEVTGEGIDPAALIKLLRRKLGFAELVSVAQLGEKKATTPSPSAASFQIIPMSEAMPWAFIPQRPTGENEELGKRKRQAEELKCKVIVLKRRIDFLGFILPYHVQSEEKESQYSLKSIFSIIHFRIRQFKGLTKKNKLATYTPEDIDRDIQRHFRTVREKLAECLLHMGAYLPQYMLENMRDLWNSDDSEGRTEGVELMMPPSSNKSENAPRPYHEDDQWLRTPQEAQNLAINSSVHQIFEYFDGSDLSIGHQDYLARTFIPRRGMGI